MEVYLEDLQQILSHEDAETLRFKVAWKWQESGPAVLQTRTLWTNRASDQYDWQGVSLGEDVSSAASVDELPHSMKLRFLIEDLNWLPALRRGYPQYAYPATQCLFMTTTLEKYLAWLDSVHRQDHPGTRGPPLDIDVFWHSHMLIAASYRDDTVSRYGKTIWHRPLADEANGPSSSRP